MAHNPKGSILLLSAVMLPACVAGAPPTALPSISTPAPIQATVTMAEAPTPPPTIAMAVVPTLPPIIVTNPIGTATPIESATPTLPMATQPARETELPTEAVLTATPLVCPPLPTPTTLDTQAAEQHFEHGLMFWLQTRNEIWALIDSPTADQFYWRVLPNLWYQGTPEADPSLQPPAGMYQPVRGFGVAWRLGGGAASLPLRDDLGWAVEEEAGFETTLTYYPQGFYSPDCTWEPKSGIYELNDARGLRYRFVGAGGVAYVVTPTP